MNIEFYIGAFLAAVSLLMIYLVIFTQRSWIKTQKEALLKSYATIEKLQDRLMSKNFDQYKMYDQPVKEYIPPEPEEEMDEFLELVRSGEIERTWV